MCCCTQRASSIQRFMGVLLRGNETVFSPRMALRIRMRDVMSFHCGDATVRFGNRAGQTATRACRRFGRCGATGHLPVLPEYAVHRSTVRQVFAAERKVFPCQHHGCSVLPDAPADHHNISWLIPASRKTSATTVLPSLPWLMMNAFCASVTLDCLDVSSLLSQSGNRSGKL